MRNKGQLKAIVNYVKENPGCFCIDIINGTKIAKSSVTSALSKLTENGVLKRDRTHGNFRYYAADDTRQTKRYSQLNSQILDDTDRPNPLTAFINQVLREVRAQ